MYAVSAVTCFCVRKTRTYLKAGYSGSICHVPFLFLARKQRLLAYIQQLLILFCVGVCERMCVRLHVYSIQNVKSKLYIEAQIRVVGINILVTLVFRIKNLIVCS